MQPLARLHAVRASRRADGSQVESQAEPAQTSHGSLSEHRSWRCERRAMHRSLWWSWSLQWIERNSCPTVGVSVPGCAATRCPGRCHVGRRHRSPAGSRRCCRSATRRCFDGGRRLAACRQAPSLPAHPPPTTSWPGTQAALCVMGGVATGWDHGLGFQELHGVRSGTYGPRTRCCGRVACAVSEGFHASGAGVRDRRA